MLRHLFAHSVEPAANCRKTSPSVLIIWIKPRTIVQKREQEMKFNIECSFNGNKILLLLH